MAESWNKRDRELKKRNLKKQKEEKKLARKENSSKGKGLDDMLAYVDEYGNLSDTIPDKRPDAVTSIPPVVRNSNDFNPESNRRSGMITFFDTSKGYGFIKDAQTKESIFVHINSSSVELKENLKVTFEVEHGPKGWAAVHVSGLNPEQEESRR
ncbi:cold shock domain-containing protein [Niabella aquatica]